MRQRTLRCLPRGRRELDEFKAGVLGSLLGVSVASASLHVFNFTLLLEFHVLLAVFDRE